MSFEELLEQAREANAAYRQYDRILQNQNCQRRVAVMRKSARGRVWYEKGQPVLQVGLRQWREDVGRVPEWYVTIWSPSADSFCLTPERTLA